MDWCIQVHIQTFLARCWYFINIFTANSLAVLVFTDQVTGQEWQLPPTQEALQTTVLLQATGYHYLHDWFHRMLMQAVQPRAAMLSDINCAAVGCRFKVAWYYLIKEGFGRPVVFNRRSKYYVELTQGMEQIPFHGNGQLLLSSFVKYHLRRRQSHPT